jgi:hypothetical protein
MHLPINVKSPNNISKWQMGFNLAFKGLKPFYSNKVQKLKFYGSGLQIFQKAMSHLKTEVPEDDAIRIPSEDALILDRHTKFRLL